MKPAQVRQSLGIEQYAAIGNGHTIALVGADGAIDWCCLPRIDSPLTLQRLLDASHGGYFALQPIDGTFAGRRYRDGTNILESSIHADASRALLIDHMPRGLPGIIRTLRGERGTVGMRAIVRAPGRSQPRLRGGALRFAIDGHDGHELVLTGPSPWQPIDTHVWESTAEVQAGEQLSWILALAGNDDGSPMAAVDAAESLARSAAEDRHWSSRIDAGGEFAAAVRRSALALRLLFHEPSGAIAAAATTSLPEVLGGERNWDYRYCWLRDSALVLDALYELGLHDEAMRFWEWLEGVVRDAGGLDIVYRVDGKPCPDESRRIDLPGYRGSQPVRVGNAASDQVQHDRRGFLLDAALRCQVAMREPHDELRPILQGLADEAAAHWREPDRGLWEMRGEPQHYVHSRLMSWVALDRALQLVQRGWLHGDDDNWRLQRDELRRELLDRGYDSGRGAFVQVIGQPQLDAAALMIPLMGFLPADDPRVLSTLDAISDELGKGDLLRRYTGDDGLPGQEGAFVACSFWRVEVLARANRRQLARPLMQRLVARANDVGLFSEQIDPHSGSFLGNFPQALSHLALIRAAIALERSERPSK